MKSFPCFSAIIFFTCCFSLHASIITVDDDGPADYQYIGYAIENAMPHDTILVAEGEYHDGPLYITKPITLLGAGQDTSFIKGLNGVVLVESDSVKIDGFTFDLGFMPPINTNLCITHCSPHITNIKFLNDEGWWPTYTIEINGASSPQIHHNNFPEGWDGVQILLLSDSLDVHAEYNWWGTTNENSIQGMIYDSHDDSSLGTVHYKPFLTQPATVNNREIDHLINTFSLYQNYPNPFNSSTVIPYMLLKDGYVRLTISDLIGNLVYLLEDGFQRQGAHIAHWDGTNLNNVPVSSGVYLSQLEMENRFITKKLIIIK